MNSCQRCCNHLWTNYYHRFVYLKSSPKFLNLSLFLQEASPKSQQFSSRARERVLEMKEKAESLQRARAAAFAADGISWGMQEDAEEEEEEVSSPSLCPELRWL